MDISHERFVRELEQAGIKSGFPNIKKDNCTVTSAKTTLYNCIAWVAGCTDKWWWPIPVNKNVYWPSGAPREETREAFVKAFEILGYSLCSHGKPERGYTKVAFYGDLKTGKPSHAAIQLKNGKWSSKLGNFYDIEHDSLDVVCGNGNGEDYGQVLFYMVRRDKAS